MKKATVVAIILTIVSLALAACDQGSGSAAGPGGGEGGSGSGGENAPPPAFDLTGGWSGVYPDTEATNNMYVFTFDEGGACTMQLAKYGAGTLSCKYYGDYTLSADGRELTLDLYHGEYETVETAGGAVEEYHDQGRANAKLFATVRFRVIHIDGVQPFVLVSQERALAGLPEGTGDTEVVIDEGVFFVMQPDSAGQRFFGETSLETGSVVPDALFPNPEASAVTNTLEGLNVRSGPGTDYDSFGTLQNGTAAYRVAAMQDGPEDWVFCLFAEGGGWLNTDYLTGGSGAVDAGAAGAPEEESTESEAV
ncbi:MAG: hypothetical protein LBR44_05860 [Clostridiales Family XIII bacterium]|jgi:hypothetical protein|nr:hypothetical protein [Clostridiales Family XIII bacterium]